MTARRRPKKPKAPVMYEPEPIRFRVRCTTRPLRYALIVGASLPGFYDKELTLILPFFSVKVGWW